jgi:arylsulfatase A-like enzyme
MSDVGFYHDYFAEQGLLEGDSFYLTPGIDALAAESSVFINSYSTSPNCAPTRAALMTGQYGSRTQLFTVGSAIRGEKSERRVEPPRNIEKIPNKYLTIGEILTHAKYTATHFGK